VWPGARNVYCIQIAQYSTMADSCDNSSEYSDCETRVTASLGKPLSVSEKFLELFCGTMRHMHMAKFQRPIVMYPEIYLWNPVFISPLEYPTSGLHNSS
jgi:hypothetical protein